MRPFFDTTCSKSIVYVSFGSRLGRKLPAALFHGTLLTSALYLLLNFVFLRTIPLFQLTGKLEVGALSADYIFGSSCLPSPCASLLMVLAGVLLASMNKLRATCKGRQAP